MHKRFTVDGRSGMSAVRRKHKRHGLMALQYMENSKRQLLLRLKKIPPPPQKKKIGKVHIHNKHTSDYFRVRTPNRK